MREVALDRFDLYELCTQTPERDVELLRAIHSAAPKILGEDFAGGAALARAWVARIRGGRAIAVDRDREALARARGVHGVRSVECICSDVLEVSARADVVVALNFSLNEWHARRDLVRYLSHVRPVASAREVGASFCVLVVARR